MGASFDILRKPWVPAVDAAGQTMELGLLETLERAHELQAIQTASPMEEYSVYRFLIVFLMDALRPEDGEEDIGGLLAAEQFDMEAIQDYLTQCRKEGVSFDLFDVERPFLQTAYVEAWDREAKPVSTLDYTIPNGNNHIHFDHRRNEISYTPGKALRMLLTAQNLEYIQHMAISDNESILEFLLRRDAPGAREAMGIHMRHMLHALSD